MGSLATIFRYLLYDIYKIIFFSRRNGSTTIIPPTVGLVLQMCRLVQVFASHINHTVPFVVPKLIALRTNAVLFVMSLGRALGVVF